MGAEFKRYSAGSDSKGAPISFVPYFYVPIPNDGEKFRTWDENEQKYIVKYLTQQEWWYRTDYTYFVMKQPFEKYKRMGGVGGDGVMIDFIPIRIEYSDKNVERDFVPGAQIPTSIFPEYYNPRDDDNQIVERNSYSIQVRWYFAKVVQPSRFDKALNPQTGWTIGLKAYQHLQTFTEIPGGNPYQTTRWSTLEPLLYEHAFSDADNVVKITPVPPPPPEEGEEEEEGVDPDAFVPFDYSVYDNAMYERGPWLPLIEWSRNKDGGGVSKKWHYTGSQRAPGADSELPYTPPPPAPPLPPEEPPALYGAWFCYKTERAGGFYPS